MSKKSALYRDLYDAIMTDSAALVARKNVGREARERKLLYKQRNRRTAKF